MDRLKCVDLFAGVGGFSEGFKRENIDIVLATDIWEVAAKTYKENHPSTPFIVKDIYEFKPKKIFQELDLQKGDIDIVLGGPPCQGFSTVGKRDENDPRNLLFKEYIRVIDEISPKVFVMENVVGILTMNNGEIYKNIINGFNTIGYKVESRILNSANYGVPQRRERVIFIGTKLNIDIEFPPIGYSETEFKNTKKIITINEAISDLPIVLAGETSTEYSSEPKNEYQKIMRKNMKDNEGVTLQSAGKHSKKLIDMMEYIPEGKSIWEINGVPDELRPKSGYGNTYARLDGKNLGMTITRNFSCVSSSRCIHPIYNRGLTAREAARIQSFPDDYKFLGTKSDISVQIGNAVPPLLSQKIARTVKKMLKEKNN